MSFGTVWPETKLNSTEPKNSITHVLEGKMIATVYCLVMRVGGYVIQKTGKASGWFPCLDSSDALVFYDRRKSLHTEQLKTTPIYSPQSSQLHSLVRVARN